MYLFPIGDVLEDRVELSQDYKLLENVNGVWRLTKKCKENYDKYSYLYYLQGKIEKPERIYKVHKKEITEKTPSPNRNDVIQGLLEL